MAEINLLQQERKSRIPANPVQVSGSIVLWILVGVIAVEMGAYGGLYYWKQRIDTATTNLEVSMVQMDKKLKDSQTDVNQAVKSQFILNTFGTLLGSHTVWTMLWDEISKTTLKSARYVGLQATAERNKMVISGEVANYTEVGKVMLALRGSSNFSSIELVSSVPSTGQEVGIRFEISVVFNPAILQAAENRLK